MQSYNMHKLTLDQYPINNTFFKHFTIGLIYTAVLCFEKCVYWKRKFKISGLLKIYHGQGREKQSVLIRKSVVKILPEMDTSNNGTSYNSN